MQKISISDSVLILLIDDPIISTSLIHTKHTRTHMHIHTTHIYTHAFTIIHTNTHTHTHTHTTHLAYLTCDGQ